MNILSFYSFVEIDQPELLMPKLLLTGRRKLIMGTILLSNEGFNGSISGKYDDCRILVDQLIDLTKTQSINLKVNYANHHVFSRFKVKIKKEIVTMGVDHLDIQNSKGYYVKPKDWDDFICDKQVVLIDTRNDYEVEIGTFKNSINPNIRTFRQFPNWLTQNINCKDKKIAMFCTGGIRCEKTTTFMKKIGYNEIYHLEGGILQYFEDTGNKNNLWQGECFVFDDRKAVDVNLKPKYL